MFKFIHHVAIICSDYKISKDFYVNILGLKIVNETYREEKSSYKLDLSVGNTTRLELFSFPITPKRANYPEARGLRHLAFSVNDIEIVKQALERKGVKVERVRTDYVSSSRKSKYTFFHDPDGLPIEIYQV